MQPYEILRFVAVLACPIGMGLMMWMMMRNTGDKSMSSQGSRADRLTVLRQQRQQLEQEIAETEKIAALETEKAALVSSTTPVDQLQPGEGASR